MGTKKDKIKTNREKKKSEREKKRRNLNENRKINDVNGNRKLFWKEVSNVKGGELQQSKG